MPYQAVVRGRKVPSLSWRKKSCDILDGKVFSRLTLAFVSEIVYECMNDVATVVALECQSSGLQGVNNKQKRFDPIPVQQQREANVVRPGKPRSQPIPQIVVHSTPRRLFLALHSLDVSTSATRYRRRVGE